MFKSFARTACLAAALVAGTAAMTAAPAAAAERGQSHITVEYRGHDRDRGHYQKWRGGRDHDARRGDRRAACSPHTAVRKARWMGIDRAHVRRSDHRSVVVSGRRWGHRAMVRFAQAPGCPVIGMR
ncbi:hypothetical protein [Consotaella aegiceratis]|uniref:hypothetical protein n=1 Tax=Consotaella aegiceratis TaxID=3097961 RepID=UPI002F3F54BC